MYKKIVFASLLVYALTLFTSCRKKVICPLNLIYYPVWVTDTNGNAVWLDEHYTIHVATQEVVVSSKFENTTLDTNTNASYIIISSGDYISDQLEEFEFVGIKDNQEIVREKYTFTFDECGQSSKQSGRSAVVANL